MTYKVHMLQWTLQCNVHGLVLFDMKDDFVKCCHEDCSSFLLRKCDIPKEDLNVF